MIQKPGSVFVSNRERETMRRMRAVIQQVRSKIDVFAARTEEDAPELRYLYDLCNSLEDIVYRWELYSGEQA